MGNYNDVGDLSPGRIRHAEAQMHTTITVAKALLLPLIIVGSVLAVTHGRHARTLDVGLTLLLMAGQAGLVALAASGHLTLLDLIRASREELLRRIDQEAEAFNDIARAAGDRVSDQRRRHGTVT